MTNELLDVIERLRVSDPLVLWHDREAIESAIRRAEWPKLELVSDTGDEDEVLAGFKCPHCGTVIDGREDRLAAVDVAERWTAVDEIEDEEAKEVRIAYDDPGEFDGLAYMCQSCCQPVSLPDGWTEVTW